VKSRDLVRKSIGRESEAVRTNVQTQSSERPIQLGIIFHMSVPRNSSVPRESRQKRRKESVQ